MSDLKPIEAEVADQNLSALARYTMKARRPARLIIEPAVMLAVTAGVLALAVFFAAPALLFQTSEIFIAILFAVSVSYVTGISGTPAFGNQLFYASGGYFVGILSTKYGVGDALVFCVAGLAIGAVFGGLMSLLLKKVSGVAFGMVSLAISQMFYVYVGTSNYLSGDNGIAGISTGALFGLSLLKPTYLLTFVVVIVTLGVATVALVARSRLGLITKASRDSGTRAATLGIPTFRYHALAFTIGAALSGLAGALTAMTDGTVDPTMFYWTAGAVPILAGLMGGIRTVKGPILGSIILSAIVIWVSQLTTAWLLIEGGATLSVFLIWPEGLLGEGRGSARSSLRRLLSRVRSRLVGRKTSIASPPRQTQRSDE